MKNDICNCFNCESDRIECGVFCGNYYVLCKTCKNSTNNHKEMKDAIKEWNDKYENNKNK